MRFLSRWKAGHLLAAWLAYWAGLVLITLGPGIVALLRVTIPNGTKGTASANVGDGGISASVTNAGATVWSGSAHTISIALCVGVPPLLLWVAWLISRPRRIADDQLDVAAPRMLADDPATLQRPSRARQEENRMGS
ncbi:MAG: hypothetical protein ABJE10_24140 [bacterium]